MRRLIEVRKPCEWWSHGTWGVPQLANKLHGLWGVGCKASHKSWDVPWSVITIDFEVAVEKAPCNNTSWWQTKKHLKSVIVWFSEWGFIMVQKIQIMDQHVFVSWDAFFCFALIWKLWPVFQSNQNSRSLSPYLWRPHAISDRLPCLRTRVEVGGTCSRWWTHVILGMVGLRIKQLQGLLGHLFNTESFEMKPIAYKLWTAAFLRWFWKGSRARTD